MSNGSTEASHATTQKGESLLNKDLIHERIASAKEAAGELYKSGKKRVMEWEEGLEESVKERPMRSLLIAAGVGFALGFLIRRR
jgi:ElaB/YqjD/DUF883 family membrane-anchored ribosome-binding protein